ncbi:MAG: winged helix-turn-helix transcriptional regulator [Candidatus Micrarchaeota archaeon]|nr:winged helix-turn-helix transcriptional regulator [Candidatus Micrarchaeota archaeon]
MGKTLETKKRILDLLKKKEMTITELSRELNLSTATVSQHMDELASMGAVEKVENEHFKKLKYYKASQTASSMIAIKYIVGAIVVIGLLALASVFYYYGHGPVVAPYISSSNNTTAQNSVQNTTVQIPGGGIGTARACPMLFYQIIGNVTGYSGLSYYQLNSSYGTVADYVLARDAAGVLHISERMANVLNEPQGFNTTRMHYAVLQQINSSNGFNMSSPGVNVTIEPTLFNITNNSVVSFTVSIAANSSAEYNTYWVRIDGQCGGGVQPFLLTVGNGPYNGTVRPQVTPYA